MKNDGREFERYLKWFKDLDTVARKSAVTSSSGISHAVASAQWEDFFNKMEEKEDE